MAKPFRNLISGCFLLSLWACMEIRPKVPPEDPPLTIGANSSCQAPPIEQNIIGTWHFESNRSPVGTLRKGIVTFDGKGNIVDPDSLFENHINSLSTPGMDKVDYKTYNTDGANGYPATFPSIDKLFVVEVGTKNKQNWVKWPMYVASNECNKIVINQASPINPPVKLGFTLTR